MRSGAGMSNSNRGDRWSAPRAAAACGSERSGRIHWLRTLAAKAQAPLRREHLRFFPASAGAGELHCFLVDCSASMLRGQQLARAKGLLMQLIQSAYQQRAEVAIVGFAGSRAHVHLPPTLARPLTSTRVEQWLQPIRAAGATPLARGAAAAAHLLARAARVRPAQRRWLWLLTDGRSPESPVRPRPADIAVVIDCEQGRTRLSRCRSLAEGWRAYYRELGEFSTGSLREKPL